MRSIKETLERFLKAWDSLPIGDHSIDSVQKWLNGAELKAAVTDARSALAQLDSADARERIAPKVQSIFADKLSIDAVNMEIDGAGPASYAIADLLISTGLLPDASPGNGVEKVREERLLAFEAAFFVALAEHNVPPDFAEILAHGDPAIGVPPRVAQKAIKAALHSTSAAGEQK